MKFRIGDRISLHNRGPGVISFIGKTRFAPGEWIGVVLDSPSGRNDGSVEEVRYFECEPGHGVFVRPSQVTLSSTSSMVESDREVNEERSSEVEESFKTTEADDVFPSPPRKRSSFDEAVKQEGLVEGSDAPTVHREEIAMSEMETTGLDEKAENRLADLEHALAEMRAKHERDKNVIKEYERAKVQILQLQEFKSQCQGQLSEAQRQVKTLEKQNGQLKDEMDVCKRDLSTVDQHIESITLDKEMAEEKTETLELELMELRNKLEEVTLEYDILKAQMDNPGMADAATTYRCDQQQLQIERLNQAFLKLRDSSVADKHELADLRRANEELSSRLDSAHGQVTQLTASVEKLEGDNQELKEQVDASLGSENIITALTERKLNLEEMVEQLNDKLADMNALYLIDNEICENVKDENKELRNQIDELNIAIADDGKKIEVLRYTVADRDQTLVKFRDLVKTIKVEVRDLRNQIRQYEERDDALRNLNIIENRAKQLESKLFEEQTNGQLVTLQLDVLKTKFDAIVLFLPRELSNAQTPERRAIDAQACLCSMHGKCALLSENLLANHYRKQEHNEIDAGQEMDDECSCEHLLAAKLDMLRFVISKLILGIRNVHNRKAGDIALNMPQFNIADSSLTSNLMVFRTAETAQLDQTIAKIVERLQYQFGNICVACNCDEGWPRELLSCACNTLHQLMQDVRRLDKAKLISIAQENEVENWNKMKWTAERARQRMIETSSYGPIADTSLLEKHCLDMLSCAATVFSIRQGLQSLQLDEKPDEQSIGQVVEELCGEADMGSLIRSALRDFSAAMSELIGKGENSLHHSSLRASVEGARWVTRLAEPWAQRWRDIEDFKDRQAKMDVEVAEYRSSLAQMQNELIAEKMKVEVLEKHLESARKEGDQAVSSMKDELEKSRAEVESVKKNSEGQLESQAGSLLDEATTSEEQIVDGVDRTQGRGGRNVALNTWDELHSRLSFASEQNAFLHRQNDQLRDERVCRMLDNLPSLESSDFDEHLRKWTLRQMEFNRLRHQALSVVSRLDLRGDLRSALHDCVLQLRALRGPALQLRQAVLDEVRAGDVPAS